MRKHKLAVSLVLVLALVLGSLPWTGVSEAAAAPAVQRQQSTLLPGTNQATQVVTLRSSNRGPVVLVVGGIHGDQPAGVRAAETVAQYDHLQRGTLIVVPALNKEAVELGRRTARDGVDLNRTFPTRWGRQPTDARSRALWNLIRSEGVDYVLDLHEGKDYQATSSSIGQLIIHQNYRSSQRLASAMVAALNQSAQGQRVWRRGGPPVISGLTRSAADVLGLDAFHVTTTTRDSLKVRVEQQLTTVHTLLAQLNMIADGQQPQQPDKGGGNGNGNGNGSVTTPPGNGAGNGRGNGGSDGRGNGTGGGSGGSGGSRPQPPEQPTPPPAGARVTTQTLAPGTKYATTLYIIDSGRPGPTVWISGGTHGSEVAGWKAADQIKNWSIARGKLLVVPRNNVPAVNNRTRSGPGDPDLNRQFPQSSTAAAKTVPARALWAALREHRPDWVIDLHEAMSARNINPSSVGQTLIAYPRTPIIDAGNAVFAQMNRSISNSDYRFQVIRYPVQGSLARAAGEFLGANAGIFETTRLVGESTRIQWQLQFVELLLDHLQMSPARSRTAAVTGVYQAA